jgi:ABC-2 type transport system permease protein
MVAHLVRLKLSLLRNSLRRSVPQVVGMVLAALYALYALGVVGLVAGGLVALRFSADVGVARSVVVVLGSAVTLGWFVVPVLLSGVDQTLDPVRFATFAVPRRQLLAGMLAAALVGIPGAVVSILALTTTVTWSRSPQAVAVALVAAVVGVLTCVTLSRMSTSGLSALGQSRRGRETASAVGGLLFVAAGLGSGLLRLALAVLVLALLLALWDVLLRRALENRARSARAPVAGTSAPGGSPACRAPRPAPSPHAGSPTGVATRATSSRSG